MKKCWLLLIFIMSLVIIPENAYANGPIPPSGIKIVLKNAPENAFGADILLLLSGESDLYLQCNQELLAEVGLTDSCELSDYSEGGYVSNLAHTKTAQYCGALKKDNNGYMNVLCCWLNNDYTVVAYKMGDLKIAVYDKTGSILAVSEAFHIEGDRGERFLGDVEYDVKTGLVTVRRYTNFIDIIGYFITLVIFAWGATIGTEAIVAACFKLRPIGYVVRINLVSNLIFNLALYICNVLISLPYWPCVIVGEIAVIIIEYSLFKYKYLQYTRRKIFFYSCVANFASFGITFLFYLL